MKKNLFDKLLESAEQMGEITRGERAPSREFNIEPDDIKQIRAKLKLSQSKFALLMQVELSTLQNWEQGRRAPTGPAKALLKAIRKDPEHVLTALAD
jgi:putative transcriptional regulator